MPAEFYALPAYFYPTFSNGITLHWLCSGGSGGSGVLAAVADSMKLVREVSGLLRKDAFLHVYRTPDQRDREKPELQKLALRFRCTDTFELPDNEGTRLFMILPGVRKK